MPIILGAIGLGLGAVGTGASLYSQNQAKKAAKRAEEENRKTAAWNALMQAAAGGVPQNGFQASAIPQVDYGGAVSQLGAGVMSAGNMLADRDYKTQLMALRMKQASDASALDERRIKVAETTADNTAQYRKGMLDNAWQARTGRDLDRMNQFEADERAADDLRKWREDQLKLGRERIAAEASKEKAIPGQISEGAALSGVVGRKEADPMAALLAGMTKQPVPSGYKMSDAARKKYAKLLKERFNWSDEDLSDLLSNEADPLGILGD